MHASVFTTDSHVPMMEKYLLPSLDRLGIDYRVGHGRQSCSTGAYFDDGWRETMTDKICWHRSQMDGDYVWFLDADTIMLRHMEPDIILQVADVSAQQDNKNICAGVMLVRVNKNTTRWIDKAIDGLNSDDEIKEDQFAINLFRSEVLCRPMPPNLFWSPGLHDDGEWKKRTDVSGLMPPEEAIVAHANWTVGIPVKEKLLEQISHFL